MACYISNCIEYNSLVAMRNLIMLKMRAMANRLRKGMYTKV